MHTNPAFRKVETVRNIAFARKSGFGTLAVNGEAGPLLSHIPFLLNEAGTEVEAHLTRSNPILRLAQTPVPAVISVLGPSGYISPDWYGEADQVPTYNYVAVHLRGTLRLADPEGMRAHLDRLSGHFEAKLSPKPIWTMEKMSEEAIARMMRMILPVHMAVTGIEGTWKLNQNKSDAARLGAAGEVADPVLADLMRKGPDAD